MGYPPGGGSRREVASNYAYAVAVTPSDSVNLTQVANALLVTATGAVAIVTPDDTVVTMSGVAANVIIPIMAKRVNVTGTTATVVALY